jgi:hypothetical protein
MKIMIYKYMRSSTVHFYRIKMGRIAFPLDLKPPGLIQTVLIFFLYIGPT